MDDENHKLFKGADLEALKPWLLAFNALVPRVNAAVHHAMSTGNDPALDFADDLASAILGRRVKRQDPSVVICPVTLRAAPTVLRELADMYEDLAKLTGLESTTPAWTPTKGA